MIYNIKEIMCPYCDCYFRAKNLEINACRRLLTPDRTKASCPECKKVFGIAAIHEMRFEGFKAPCLNGARHVFQSTPSINLFRMFDSKKDENTVEAICKVCGHSEYQKIKPKKPEKVILELMFSKKAKKSKGVSK
jgi:hypothetical protein